ncbi:glutathione S-transferase 1-like [Nomia melanderi]|uniref:glutathione S-transferase 1-like n=1 Tax=Nomia melanderi TaxID=2448451 RepID=UPI0013044F51|nr:glutathione S-transferase 1-like [Nomia melanderi]XP_031840002.1 glutathione S-transferase 1-like [Nomia melanderi]XP_031840003.1 glutathione S-transferase 1-like [Nomia melanderi]XP_031840004.1 glutathione S-transferase 1-like [Nomia melanderi]
MPDVILYAHEISGPCRAVLMTAHAIDLPLDVRKVNMAAKEHQTEEFTKINPQRLIPAINDNGFTLSDSHAINCYLVSKYAKNDALYPKDLQKRARVDQFLHMDSSALFAAARNAFTTMFRMKTEKGKNSKIEAPEANVQAMRDAYDSLNRFLEGRKWLVGDSYTLADISCATTASCACVILNLEDYPNVNAWLKRCELELPGYKEHNEPGNNLLLKTMRSKLSA